MIRQYFPYNLRQRILSIPLLTYTDKLWITLQLLCGVCQIHGENKYHGDIKLTNVMLTSWNWLFLVDFAPYYPDYVDSEDIGTYNCFFSPDSKKTAGCYLAPERFMKISGGMPEPSLKFSQAGDIFALGCVLAEIFLDGETLFDLPQLKQYKEGEYSPMSLLKDIENEDIRNIIVDMIQIDPTMRKTAEEYLLILVSKVMPSSFMNFSYYFMASMLHQIYSSSDRKVAAIYSHLDAIWLCCFNKKPPCIEQSMNGAVFEAIRETPLGGLIPNIIPKGFNYCVKYIGHLKEIIPETLTESLNPEMKYFLIS